MREEYEIQLIDETSGEQIKTVSPTVESHTVYHGEKKLSGYLKQVEEQSKLYKEFEEVSSKLRDNPGTSASFADGSNISWNDDTWEIDGDLLKPIKANGWNQLYIDVGHIEPGIYYIQNKSGFNVHGFTNITNNNVISKEDRADFMAGSKNLEVKYTKGFTQLQISLRGTPEKPIRPIKLSEISVTRFPDSKAIKTEFPNHVDNIFKINDLVSKQSKSSLILVTTMQKLLSEKIEELENLAKKQSKQPANLWGGNINNSMYVGAELIGDYYYLKEDHQINNVGVTRDTDSSLWSDKPDDGDTIYTHIWISAERDIDYVPELHYRNNKYVPEVTGKTIRRGMNHLVFEHELIDTSDLTTTFKTSLLKGIKMYDLIMVTKTKGYFDYIESRVQIDYQEELDFYKSQLEKLKLTQEVDLNLLLTL